MRKSPVSLGNRRWQSGVTLVELMVSVAIGLVIALAVTVAYVAVRGTSTATDATSRINEDGKLALDMLTREIQMAGFYPAGIPASATPNLRGVYTNIKSGTTMPYNQGVFGCSSAKFSPATGACGSADPNDSIVLNYFSSASVTDVGTTNISVSHDCLNGDLNNDPVNAALAIGQPRFVSNRFAINATTYDMASSGSVGGGLVKTINTGSLSCNGNGKKSEDDTYQPIFEGVAQMVIRYAVNGSGASAGASASGSSETPERFYTADEVSALLTVGGLNGWQRVAAVRVCLLMQSLTGGRNDSGRDESASGKPRTYVDCKGKTVTQPMADRNIYKTFTRLVAVRNQLTGVQ